MYLKVLKNLLFPQARLLNLTAPTPPCKSPQPRKPHNPFGCIISTVTLPFILILSWVQVNFFLIFLSYKTPHPTYLSPV